MLVTITDIREAGHCARGARTWAKQQGIDFRRFISPGVPAAEILATGDGQGFQVVERTIARRWPDADVAALLGNPIALLALIAEREAADGR